MHTHKNKYFTSLGNMRWGLQITAYLMGKQQHSGAPFCSYFYNPSVLHIYAFTSLSKTRRLKRNSHSRGQRDEKWNDLPSAEMLATSVSMPLVNKGAEGCGERENKKEMSANYNVQQANLQYKLRLSQAPLKNGSLPAMHWLGVRNSQRQKEQKKGGEDLKHLSLPWGSHVCTTCINVCQCFKILRVVAKRSTSSNLIYYQYALFSCYITTLSKQMCSNKQKKSVPSPISLRDNLLSHHVCLDGLHFPKLVSPWCTVPKA